MFRMNGACFHNTLEKVSGSNLEYGAAAGNQTFGMGILSFPIFFHLPFCILPPVPLLVVNYLIYIAVN